MNENEMLMCLIAFILGYLVSRHMGNRIVGDGFSVGAQLRCMYRGPGQADLYNHHCNINTDITSCNTYISAQLDAGGGCEWREVHTPDQSNVILRGDGGSGLTTETDSWRTWKG